LALPIRFPVKLESQKIKPPVVRPAVVPEAQRLGLIRCHFQPKLGQPFFQPFLKGFGFMPMLEARHKIIRIANQSAAPLLLRSLYPLKPQVQRVVQIDVG
jgi:hypothetical protein